MDEETIRKQLHEFIVSELIHQPQRQLAHDDPLITSGLINSFSIVELSLFIESNFGVLIADADLTARNMDTLDKIVHWIQQAQ